MTTSAARGRRVAESAFEDYSVLHVTQGWDDNTTMQKRSYVRRLIFKSRPRNKDRWLFQKKQWFTRPYRPWTSRRRRP